MDAAVDIGVVSLVDPTEDFDHLPRARVLAALSRKTSG
jgi:hypothetical protein